MNPNPQPETELEKWRAAKIHELMDDLATLRRKLEAVEKDSAALRNAADGMAEWISNELSVTEECSCPCSGRDILAAYRALTADGPTETKS